MDNKDLPVYSISLKPGEVFDGMTTINGLSKRELIAAMAMQGLLANYEAQQDMQNDPRYDKTNFSEVLAANSIDFADALLKELEK